MRTGPPLPETLRLLAPLAPKLELLFLGGNKLGGTITDEIAAFTKLTKLSLALMGLDGAPHHTTSPRKPITTEANLMKRSTHALTTRLRTAAQPRIAQATSRPRSVSSQT